MSQTLARVEAKVDHKVDKSELRLVEEKLERVSSQLNVVSALEMGVAELRATVEEHGKRLGEAEKQLEGGDRLEKYRRWLVTTWISCGLLAVAVISVIVAVLVHHK